MVVSKLKRTAICSIYQRQFKRKWEASSLIYPQTHLESVIDVFILDRDRSNIWEIQLRHNLAYEILDLLFLAKKCPAILASTTYLLSLI